MIGYIEIAVTLGLRESMKLRKDKVLHLMNDTNTSLMPLSKTRCYSLLLPRKRQGRICYGCTQKRETNLFIRIRVLLLKWLETQQARENIDFTYLPRKVKVLVIILKEFSNIC